MNNKVVLIPTFNESGSITSILKELGDLNVDIIVIDDQSPDGTAQLIEKLELPNVLVIHHGQKKGIGPAYISGFKKAIEKGYAFIATMDADGSHQVKDLANLFEQCEQTEVVMGSRWIQGGSVSNWSRHRIILSKLGTWYARICLDLPFKDLTGGLRIYSANSLCKLNLDSIRSNGYCFQIEMIRALTTLDTYIKEFPIHFIERRKGKSKMSHNIVMEAFMRVSLWGVQRIFRHNADKLHYVK
jgi:dolichol-phosphate mannosyltransferase